jgi:hypothetical protein
MGTEHVAQGVQQTDSRLREALVDRDLEHLDVAPGYGRGVRQRVHPVESRIPRRKSSSVWNRMIATSLPLSRPVKDEKFLRGDTFRRPRL